MDFGGITILKIEVRIGTFVHYVINRSFQEKTKIPCEIVEFQLIVNLTQVVKNTFDIISEKGVGSSTQNFKR